MLTNMFTDLPPLPTYLGEWRAIQLEPIIGSGERITVVIFAQGQDGKHKAIQAIRPELLECLYGNKATNMKSMIQHLINSISLAMPNLTEWIPPFDGVIMSKPQYTRDENLNGILRQAIQFSASLSSLSLVAEREEDDQDGLVKKEESRWVDTIKKMVLTQRPELRGYFNVQYQLSSSPARTKFNFASPSYIANLGVLQPARLSPSIQTLKSKLFDMESLHQDHPLSKSTKKELIISMPDLDNDPVLPKRTITNLKDNLAMLREISENQDILFFTASNNQSAVNRIIQMHS